MKEVLVYIIDGFLDSGKTTFINQTILSKQFAGKGNTLLITCEEGEIETEKNIMEENNVYQLIFEDSKDFSMRKVNDYVKNHDIFRIILEKNAMWDFDYNTFPSYCRIVQDALFINFETFPIYFNNMRQKYVEMIKDADLVIFNRSENIDDIRKYQTNLKLINNRAQYIMLDEEGRGLLAFEETLPFDIDADIIKIEDVDYGVWYMDTFDNKNRYIDKTVEFNAMAVVLDRMPKNTFIAGRLVMTCCADDIQLFGHLCNSFLDQDIKDRDWVHIVCKVNYQYSEEYQEEEAVLTPIEITKIEEIKEPILNF